METAWQPLDSRIYKAMHVIMASAGIELSDFVPREAKDELLLITGVLNALNHFAKLGWDNDAAAENSLKKPLNLELVTAWWQLVNNNYDDAPTPETLNASDSEAYDWNRLLAIIVRFYLNRAVKAVTDT
jgi:hypothetical protein